MGSYSSSLVVLFNYKISNLINLRSEIIQQKLAALTNLTQQFVSSIKIIKSSNAQKDSLNEFNDYSTDYLNSQLRLIKINFYFFHL